MVAPLVRPYRTPLRSSLSNLDSHLQIQAACGKGSGRGSKRFSMSAATAKAKKAPSPKMEMMDGDTEVMRLVDKEGYIFTAQMPRKLLVDAFRWDGLSNMSNMPKITNKKEAKAFLETFSVPISEMDWYSLSLLEAVGGDALKETHEEELAKRWEVLFPALKNYDFEAADADNVGHVCGLAYPRVLQREVGFIPDAEGDSNAHEFTYFAPSQLEALRAEMYRRDMAVIRQCRKEGGGLEFPNGPPRKLYGIHCKTPTTNKNLECAVHRVMKDGYDLAQELSVYYRQVLPPGELQDCFLGLVDLCTSNLCIGENLLRKGSSGAELALHDTLAAMTTRVCQEYTVFRPMQTPSIGTNNLRSTPIKLPDDPLIVSEPSSRKKVFEQLVSALVATEKVDSVDLESLVKGLKRAPSSAAGGSSSKRRKIGD